MMRVLFVLVLSLGARQALAQTCTATVDPTLEFGTQVGLPTPGTVVSSNISVTCNLDANQGIRICVGISAGSGTGSTLDNRRMSIATPVADDVGYALFKDAALSQAFGETGDDRAGVNISAVVAGQRTAVFPVYGRLTPGQTGKSVGDYLSTLNVAVATFNPSKPNCNGGGAVQDTGTFQAHFRLDPACTITAAPLDFGSVAALTGHDAATNLAVTCTLQGAYSIALDGGTVTGVVGNRQMRLGAGPDTIGYQLYRDAGRTQVWGNSVGTLYAATGNGAVQSVPVYGRVPSQAAKPSGTYVDVVTATITF